MLELKRLAAAAALIMLAAVPVAAKDWKTVRIGTEGAYPPVFYVPKADIDMTRLSKTPTASHCPHKGDATYWSLRAGDETIVDAGWSYDAPFDAVSEIKNHIAFYASKLRIEAA